jgi:hypothetical protein
MIKNIVVKEDTHPELYDNKLGLGLDITGDMVTVDTDKGLICRYPITMNCIISLSDNPNLQYLFDEVEAHA